MDTTLPVLAGTVSTIVFVGSVLPMLRKAFRTRELSSYSPGNIVLANVGNTVHSVYVFALPPGPICSPGEAALAAEYEVDPRTLTAELDGLVDELEAAGLLVAER